MLVIASVIYLRGGSRLLDKGVDCAAVSGNGEPETRARFQNYRIIIKRRKRKQASRPSVSEK